MNKKTLFSAVIAACVTLGILLGGFFLFNNYIYQQKQNGGSTTPSTKTLPKFSTFEDLKEAYSCNTEDSLTCLKQHADENGMYYEAFVIKSLSHEAKITDELITPQQALQAVEESDIMQDILDQMPNLLEVSDIYSTREAVKLSESELWFPVDASLQNELDQVSEKMVWQILIPCKTVECPSNEFVNTLNTLIPQNKDYSDLIFIVDAENGDILFSQKGTGQRGDAIFFHMQWVNLTNR